MIDYSTRFPINYISKGKILHQYDSFKNETMNFLGITNTFLECFKPQEIYLMGILSRKILPLFIFIKLNVYCAASEMEPYCKPVKYILD